MTLSDLHARADGIAATRCKACQSSLAADQRYCVECGTRRGPLPRAVAAALAQPANTGPRSDEPLPPTDDDLLAWADGIQIPAAWQAAAAIIGLLGFGVVAGSLNPGPGLASAATPIAYAQAAAPVAPAVAAPTTPAAADSAEVPAIDAAADPAVADTPEVTDASDTASSDDKAASDTPVAPSTPVSTNGLPPVKHVFMIVLSGHGADDAFGASSASPYLSTTLKGQGEYLANYYAVAQSPLANGVALISGQGPTPETAANCPTFTDIAPATPGDNGQVLGTGCVYPKATRTLGDQLSQDGETWKAYVEDSGAGGSDDAKTCRHPALGAADPDAAPTTGDGFVTWRNPFAYFHSVIDDPNCAKNDVGLDQLVPDLASAATTPSLSYIVPSRCNDGTTEPCAPGATGGLASTDTFLRIVVPEIQASAAYKDGGLIAITFDGAPQTGDGADTTSCCDTPAYPNLPATTPAATTPTDPAAATTPAGAVPTTPTDAATTTGGGRVGLLLLSDFVKAGSTNLTSSYNHYSLLASVENLFSLDKLGYAAVPTLPTFDVSIYNGKF